MIADWRWCRILSEDSQAETFTPADATLDVNRVPCISSETADCQYVVQAQMLRLLDHYWLSPVQ